MKDIKRVSEDLTTSAAPKEQSFHPQSQEFNIFMNTLASVVEKHGAEVLKELDCVV